VKLSFAHEPNLFLVSLTSNFRVHRIPSLGHLRKLCLCFPQLLVDVKPGNVLKTSVMERRASKTHMIDVC
jgi:hypothetical protein